MSKDLDFSQYYICLAAGENRLLEQLIALRDQIIKKPNHQFQIEVTGLHTGDLLIGRCDTSTQENEWVQNNFISKKITNFQPLLLIERKTINDFASSFRSNHYHSQKSRMMTYREQTHCPCALIVEEFYPTKKKQNRVGTIPIATLEQCFTSIRVRDKFLVEHVDNVTDHARFIIRTLKTMEKYKLYKNNWANEQSIQDNLHKDFQSSLKVRKKENLTPELCYKIQLSSIPGVSLNMAEKLTQVYPNLMTLMTALQEGGEKTLIEVSLGKMKFGKVKSKRVYEYLLQK